MGCPHASDSLSPEAGAGNQDKKYVGPADAASRNLRTTEDKWGPWYASTIVGPYAVQMDKKPDGTGRTSGSVQLANEEYIFCYAAM